MSKEERRQLFEKKVKESSQPVQQALLSTPPPPPPIQPSPPIAVNMNFKWMFDAQIGQWIQIYCNGGSIDQQDPFHKNVVQPPPPLPPATTGFYNNIIDWSIPPPPLPIQNGVYSIDPYCNFYPLPPPPPPPPPPLPPAPSSNLIPIIPSISKLTSIQISDANLKGLQEAVQQFLPPKSVSEAPLQSKINDDDTDIPPPPPPLPQASSIKEKKPKLPLNWKCAKNSEGRIYYYNKITKKSQWNFPKYEKLKEYMEPSPASPPLPPPPVSESVSSSALSDSDKTTVTAADTSSETYKKRRDLLREKLSKLIISLLQPYLKDDCKVGHIANSDDFKHLARKFTHAILDKELERDTKPEDVEKNKRIRVKTELYITKYMVKFNGDYSRKKDE